MATEIDIKPLKYQVRGETAAAWKQIESRCNAITFINTGTQVCIISPLQLVLNPGQQFMVSGDTGELDVTPYECSFIPQPGTAPALLIIRKTYQ